MIRTGRLCETCKPGQCEEKEYSIACPECNEAGCAACDNLGRYQMDACPKLYSADCFHFIRHSDLANKGLYPVDGGSVDQAERFLSAHFFYRDELSLIRAEGSDA